MIAFLGDQLCTKGPKTSILFKFLYLRCRSCATRYDDDNECDDDLLNIKTMMMIASDDGDNEYGIDDNLYDRYRLSSQGVG